MRSEAATNVPWAVILLDVAEAVVTWQKTYLHCRSIFDFVEPR